MNKDAIAAYYTGKLIQALKDSPYDGILIAPSNELAFYTGFSPMLCERFQGWFLKDTGESFYFCNLLYADQMREAYGGCPVYTWFDGESMTDRLKPVLEQYDLLGRRLLVNQSVQAFQILAITQAMDITFADGKSFLERICIRKTDDEMENLRRSAQIADRAFDDVLHFIRPGVREGQIRDFLAGKMSEYGGTEGGGLVASGPNAGYPHYCEDSRIIGERDHMILDFGCRYEGMYSDMSRTVFVGEIDEEIAALYDIVDASQRAGQAAAVKGAFIPDVDRAARSVIEEAGYGGRFPYRLGHGVGYTVHEEPYMHGNNPLHLDTGMAFSVEPGIYLPGRGGVRIENVVLINGMGETEVLNQAPREKIVLRG